MRVEFARRDALDKGIELRFRRGSANAFEQDGTGDGEHLVTGVVPAVCFQLAGSLKFDPVGRDGVRQRFEALALDRGRLQDRWAA